MLFYITGKSLGAAAGSEPEAIAAILQFAVIASGEVLIEWEQAGIIKGGISAGSRTSSIVMEAESHAEVNTRLRSLPYWGLVDWTITPLVSFEDALASDRVLLENFKATMLA